VRLIKSLMSSGLTALNTEIEIKFRMLWLISNSIFVDQLHPLQSAQSIHSFSWLDFKMISSRTWEVVTETFNNGYDYRFLGFYFKRKGKFIQIIIDPNQNLVKLFLIFSLACHFIAIPALLAISIWYISDMQVTFFYIAMMSLILLIMGLQFWHVSKINEIPSLISRFMEFHKYNCKLLHYA